MAIKEILTQLRIIVALTSFSFGGSCKDSAAVPVVTHPPSLPTVDAGAYDPSHAFDRIHTLAYEAIWVSWDKYKNGQLSTQLKKVASKGRQPVITIEPFPIKSIGTADTLLRDITAGKYDAVISGLARDVNSSKAPACIRWGAEMEHTEAYPWAKKTPNDYIAAFRQFVSLFKQGCPSARFVWSPVGNEGGEAYYPGDDVVDFTGFSIYELPVSSTRWFGHPMSFTDWMDNKYPRIAQYNKPMILAEVGVSDTRENQKIWLANAFAALPNYPLAKAFIYFNAIDIHSWKKWGGKAAPNWTIDPKLFSQNLKPNQFPFQWTLQEFEQHFGKSTDVSGGDPPKYTFDNGDYLITVSFVNGAVSRIRYQLKNGQFNEKRSGYLMGHTAPQTQWNFTDTKDGLIHFTGKYVDNYAGLMSDNFTALTVWSKADPETQTTK